MITSSYRSLALLLCLAGCTASAEKPKTAPVALPAVSDVVKVPRPEQGEYMGLYLKGQKIGFMYSAVALSKSKDTVTAVTEAHIRAKVGPDAISDRTTKETRVYEAKPGGRLLSFVMEMKGDGGDQVLEGTALPTGMRLVRKKPGLPSEVKMLPASKELVEDADQARVALLRNAKVSGTITDGLDMEQYAVTTTVGTTEVRTIAGVKVKLRKVSTISDKDKVPVEALIDEQGRMLEVKFGPMMTGLLEPEDIAKRFDVVEVFGLTRVVLPKEPSASAGGIPGKFTMVISGVPEKFWINTNRQVWKGVGRGKVEVTISAVVPTKLKPLPLVDPNGGENLKSTLAVEAGDPAIQALAKQIIGGEKDAWTAAKKITEWVNVNLSKDYGSSSDTATGVLATKKGDCTEHSLLAVSLLRAAGIPSKRIDGLVYLKNTDGVPALYWHEWVEAFVGEWTQLDPTFGQPVASALRLAVGEESKAEITPLIGSMAVVEVK